MGKLRKPDPNIMTKEDYAIFNKAYEAQESKASIRKKLNKANESQAAKEAAYKPAEPIPKVDYGNRVAPTITEPAGAVIKKELGEAVTTYKLPDGTTTTIKPSPATGWQNVIATLQVALNPFSEDKIIATMGGKTFRTVAEFVANHPYITALTAALGITGGKALIASAQTNIAAGKFAALPYAQLGVKHALPFPLVRIGGTYATNTVTRTLTGNMLTKAGFSLVSASVILGAIGSYPFARFELVEAMDKIGMARWKAFEAGDKDSMDALNALQDEILNPEGWNKIMRQIPYANIWDSVGANLKAAEANRKVFDKLITDEQAAKDSGLSEDEKWKKIKQDEADQEKEAVDYYNSERKKLIEWEHEAEAAAIAAQQAEYTKGREEQRAADIKAREEDARFWAKERERQRELEAADRKAIADFWAAYRKQMQKIKEDSRPSQLNFGLL